MKINAFFNFSLCAASFFLLSIPVQAASFFADTTLEGHKGSYLVIRSNVNVRNKPSSSGEKLSKLEKRDHVEILGRAKGTQWLAARQDDKDLGFIYATSATPIIDGSFEGPLGGHIDMRENDKPDCSFEITHEGRFEEDDIVFVSSDYLARFKCQAGFDIFQFSAMMFMSEVPHDLGQKPVYQITLNLPDIATGYEEFLSATSLYHQTEEKVVMDAVSLKAFKDTILQASLPATDPKEALIAAIKLQLQSFNSKAWKTISGKIPEPGEKEPD